MSEDATPAEPRADAGPAVLYRRWRPQTFTEVVGQEPVTTTLRHAIEAASPAHAYLFTGPRGTGKTSTGRILAKAVNCEHPADGEPDNACTSCRAFLEGRALDLIELDAASNRGIDEVRALRESVGYAPNAARFKVYLVDEVHMLTDAAFNALLKTLEEPPSHVIFVLATTEPHKIPATIASRCQRFDFRRIPLASMVEYLGRVAAGEGITVAEGGLELIAREATGSLRDATNLLDQLRSYHGAALDLETVRSGLGLVVDDRTSELAVAAVRRDLSAGLTLLSAARDDGVDIRAFLRTTVEALRMTLLLRAGATEERGDGDIATLRELAEASSSNDIVAALRALGEVDFAGDAYDSLPAEIAFAVLAIGLSEADVAPAPAPREPAVADAQAPAPARPAQRARRRSEPRAAAQDAAAPTEPREAREAEAPASGRRRNTRAAETPSPEPREPDRGAASPQREQAGGRGTQPPALPDGAPGNEELSKLREQWTAIRDQVRKKNRRAGAILNSVWQFKTFEGDTIEIGFRFPIHVEKARTLEDGKVLQTIREVLSERAGRPVQVTPVLWEALEQAAPRAGGAASPSGPPSSSGPPNDQSPPPGNGNGAPSRPRGGHLVEEARRLGAVPVEAERGSSSE